MPQELTDNNNQPKICILQGQEVYVLANEDDVSSSCDDKNELSSVHSLEVHISGEQTNGYKGTTQDEDLTPLSWLQNTNLLQSNYFKNKSLRQLNSICKNRYKSIHC